MKTYNFQVNVSHWMRSHEQAFIKIHSPKGNYRYIRKASLRSCLLGGDPEDQLYRQFLNLIHEKLINGGTIPLTLDEANLIHKFAK